MVKAEIDPKEPIGSESISNNEVPPVPEKERKVKHNHGKTNPINVNNKPDSRVYRSKPKSEKPISSAYPVIDTDIARDNIENDLSAADLQDL